MGRNTKNAEKKINVKNRNPEWWREVLIIVSLIINLIKPFPFDDLNHLFGNLRFEHVWYIIKTNNKQHILKYEAGPNQW